MNQSEQNSSLITATAGETRMSMDTDAGFKFMQRVAKMLTSSQLVPKQFQGEQGMPNAIIALNMSTRMQADPMAVMQNLYIVHGKPAFSSTFLIATVNACGRFTPLRFKLTGKGDSRSCYAVAKDKETGEDLIGSTVSIEMAKKEGWYQKNGSKWQTMPDQMLQYRAASFWTRVYAPEISMGMRPEDEIRDIESAPIDVTPQKPEETKTRNEQLAEKLSAGSGSSLEEDISVPPQAEPADSPFTESQHRSSLQDFLDLNDISFDTFRAWMQDTGRMNDADACASIEDVPVEICEGLLASPQTLKQLKEAAA